MSGDPNSLPQDPNAYQLAPDNHYGEPNMQLPQEDETFNAFYGNADPGNKMLKTEDGFPQSMPPMGDPNVHLPPGDQGYMMDEENMLAKRNPYSNDNGLDDHED
jgi:hypothetical protein